MAFAEALALVLNMIYLILVYYGIFEISKAIYRRSTIWLIAFLIFLSPFAFTIILADSLVGLMWVFALTPFIAVAILMIYFTKWLLLYYGVAYGILAVSYYVLRYVRAIRKRRIDVISKLARPMVFILKEQNPLQIRDDIGMIRESPIWNKICDFAYDKGGTVKFLDLNNEQDRNLLREGGFIICLGDKSKATAEYLQNLGLPIEILMASDLVSEEE